jgi:site-specific recombinase XerD
MASPKKAPPKLRELYPRKGEKSPLPFAKDKIADCIRRPGSGDISEWIRFYLRHEVLGVESANSFQAKRYDLHKFRAFFEHTCPGKNISAWDKALTGSFRDTVREEYNQDTLYRVMATVVNFANFLVDWRVFPPQSNPGRRIRLPARKPLPFEGIQIKPIIPSSRKKKPVLSRSEIYGMFMSACEDLIREKSSWPKHLQDRALPLRDRAILWILFNTGIRVSEICELRTEQKAPAERSKGVWFYGVKCKGNKDRNIFVPQEGAHLMDIYLDAERPKILEQIDKTALPPLHVFLSWRARKLERSAVWDIVKKVSNRASTYLPPGFMFYAHPHSFRHERGYLLRESGEGDSFVAEQLGHSGLSQVHRYTQGAQGEEEDRLERIRYTNLPEDIRGKQEEV